MARLLTLGPVGNIFYFVQDFETAVAWYTARLGRSPVATAEQLVAFDIDGVRLTIHKQDELNSPGPTGVAAYWTVKDVDAIVAEWTKYGAKAHRGPKTVFTGERLCQLLDPFGNLFAIRQAPPLASASAVVGTAAEVTSSAGTLPLTLEDQSRIAELITAADACATRRDAENYIALFTEFGIMDGSKGDFCGPAAIRDAVLHVWQAEPHGTMHITTMISIVGGVTAGTALATSTLLTVVQQPPQLLAATPIRHEVRFVQDTWRIARRTIG